MEIKLTFLSALPPTGTTLVMTRWSPPHFRTLNNSLPPQAPLTLLQWVTFHYCWQLEQQTWWIFHFQNFQTIYIFTAAVPNEIKWLKVSKTGNSHMWTHSECFVGIWCRNSAFLLLYPLIFIPPLKVCFTRTEICVFADNSHVCSSHLHTNKSCIKAKL